MMSDVQNVILLSLTPKPLNINTATMLRTTNGRPIAKYTEGTHAMGFVLVELEFDFVGCIVYRFLKHMIPSLTGLTPNPSPRGEGRDMLCCHVTFYSY